ncbi:MAG: 30S ribosome-binding factor RbfA [candidate division NC10 bacterium]|jgi:ribosome-binding factor A|nr:30S ribosome-binding factor RbfA [candidate division NC10 bacterium]
MSRAARVGDLLKEEISDLLLRNIRDPRIGFVTITEVHVSADLRHARVYFVTHEGGEEQQRTLEGLESARGYLRGELGRRLHLRYAPDLSFTVDETLDHSFKIREILKSLETEVKLDEE